MRSNFKLDSVLGRRDAARNCPSLSLDFDTGVASSLQLCRLAAGAAVVTKLANTKPHAGSSKCRKLKTLAAGTWFSCNRTHTTDNDKS